MEEYHLEESRNNKPFGDVVQKAAMAMYQELSTLMYNLRSQSPVLRTQRLLAYIARTKKRLAQLLAIARWLGVPGVTQFFNNMGQLKTKIWTKDNELNMLQDGLFFTHGGLFSRRLRPLDVLTARDILARGRCDTLPASLFVSAAHIHAPPADLAAAAAAATAILAPSSSSSSPLSASSGDDAAAAADDADVAALRRSLNIYLRAKIMLHDPVPADVDAAAVDHGVLTLRVLGLFELVLTLDHLDEQAPWNVLRYRTLAGRYGAPRQTWHHAAH
jgi:Mediator complex subunit MED14